MPRPTLHLAKGAISLYALVVVGIALTAVLAVSKGGRADGTPVPVGLVYDSMIPPTDEGRAQFGQIFIGEVIAVAGEDTIPTSDPEDVLPVILYDVEVEQTLKGEAAGRVRIWYEGFDYRGPDSKKAEELRIGDRYLFFAGFDPANGWYPVNAGLAVVPINNRGEVADLIATFEPLIQRAERRADRIPAEDACEQAGQPVISVEPTEGAQGDTVRVSGANFVRPEVSIWWDGAEERLATGTVADDCSMTVEVTIPKADPGDHRIVVRDARAEAAEATFTVIAE